MTAYVQWLRRHIGQAKTPLVYASAIITDARGAILFQRRTDFGDAWWGLPGGLMELGESITDTLVREIYEETGLHIRATRLVGLYTSPDYDVIYPSGDQVQQITACFACQVSAGALDTDADEIIEHRYCAPDALPRMPIWYAAMVDDFLANRPAATFRSGNRGKEGNASNDTYGSIRHAIGGPDPMIVVAASAFVRKGDRVLLQRRSDNGLWGVPGGALELGERIDQTVVREVKEETGVEVEALRLVGVYSDPDWGITYPDSNAIQIFVAHFECNPVGGAARADGVESLDVGYFALADLPTDLPERYRARIADTLAAQQAAIIR